MALFNTVKISGDDLKAALATKTRKTKTSKYEADFAALVEAIRKNSVVAVPAKEWKALGAGFGNYVKRTTSKKERVSAPTIKLNGTDCYAVSIVASK